MPLAKPAEPGPISLANDITLPALWAHPDLTVRKDMFARLHSRCGAVFLLSEKVHEPALGARQRQRLWWRSS